MMTWTAVFSMVMEKQKKFLKGVEMKRNIYYRKFNAIVLYRTEWKGKQLEAE